MTVSLEMNIRSAIWGLVSPSATSSATLTSVGVSDSQPPGGRRRGPRARRAHSSASSVLSSAPWARAASYAVVAERLSKPAVDLSPVLGLGRHPDDADLGAGALGRGEQPHRVFVGLEARRDLRQRVEAGGHVGRVAALDAGVEVRERVLLGVRPLAARGGQAAEGEGGARLVQAMAKLRPARPRPERGGLGGAVRQQSLRLGEQAERPRA